MNASSPHVIAKVNATGRKLTKVDMTSSRNEHGYGFHDIDGYMPLDIDSYLVKETDNYNDLPGTNTGDGYDTIDLYDSNNSNAVSTNVIVYKSTSSKYITNGGYSIDGSNGTIQDGYLHLQTNKTYTFDVSSVKNNNKFALSTDQNSYVVPSQATISEIFNNSDTITIKANQEWTNNNYIINLGSSPSQSNISVKSNNSQGFKGIMFRATDTNGKADFEITKDKLNLDFSADIVSGSSWKRNQPYTEKLILPGNITNNQNDGHTSNNFDQQYNLHVFLPSKY